jgi:hypothetical protein
MSSPPTGFYPGGLLAYRERQRARLAEIQAQRSRLQAQMEARRDSRRNVSLSPRIIKAPASNRPLRIRRPEEPPEAPPLPGIQAEASDDDLPGSPVSPPVVSDIPGVSGGDARHINRFNHQLYNIHAPIPAKKDDEDDEEDEEPLQGIYKIIKRQDKERKQKKKEKIFFKENMEAGNIKSPWTRIKPLKPDALDDYDRDINAYRARQRREQSAILSGNQRSMKENKWVKVINDR